MKLISQRVHMNKCGCRESRQITLDRDFNVPDARPDVLSIMKEQGNIQIEEVQLKEGRAVVKGILFFQILYAAEGEVPVSEMSGTIPFEETLLLSCAERQEDLRAKAEIGDLRSEWINSRKIAIKALLSLEVRAETVCDTEGATDVEEGPDVYTKRKEMEVSRLVFSGRDTIRSREEWKVPGTKDAIGEILYSDFRLMETDMRLMENELQVNGQASLFVIYLSDGDNPELNYFETAMPVEGTISCGGCDSDMVVQAVSEIHSRDLEIKQDEDGENRILDAEFVIGFDIRVFGQERLALLTDFYSTKEICEPVYENAYFENLIVQNRSRARISGSFSVTGSAPLQIWNVTGDLRVDRLEQKEDVLLAEGVIDVNILYTTGEKEKPIASAKGVIPFEHRIEAEGIRPDSHVHLQCTMEQISANPAGDNEIEIKAAAGMEVTAFRRMEEPVISGFEIRERDKTACSREPGMTGYIVREGEDMWDIAKRFFTTGERIRDVNHLDGEEVKAGDALLILKESC